MSSLLQAFFFSLSLELFINEQREVWYSWYEKGAGSVLRYCVPKSVLKSYGMAAWPFPCGGH